MFSIGSAEPVAATSSGLVRHSIVWLGDASRESSRGLLADHPLCRVLLRILDRASFVGSWLLCRDVSGMREFERKSLLLRLHGADWTVDPDQTGAIRAHRAVGADAPWPYNSEPALPWPQSEVLIVGSLLDYAVIACGDERAWRSQQSVRGDGLVLHSEVAKMLSVRRCYAISVGRTQTDSSPGLSIIGPDEWLNPEDACKGFEVIGVHSDADAGRAWSYGRQSPKS